jgi:uncharacterized protein YjbJ (UPF0337 family)
MTSTADRVLGFSNKAVGRAKRTLGAFLGLPRLSALGALQETIGQTQSLTAYVRVAIEKRAGTSR